MTRLLQINKAGNGPLFGLFESGQVGMLDVSDPENPTQQTIVSLGVGFGRHDIQLDARRAVTDYFLNEDDFGKVHAEAERR
jgi:hypothetical protein